MLVIAIGCTGGHHRSVAVARTLAEFVRKRAIPHGEPPGHGPLRRDTVRDDLFDRRDQGPRVVAIGGGTGLSTCCGALKNHTKNLTAIVTVADDGGGSGMLRQDLGMPRRGISATAWRPWPTPSR